MNIVEGSTLLTTIFALMMIGINKKAIVTYRYCQGHHQNSRIVRC